MRSRELLMCRLYNAAVKIVQLKTHVQEYDKVDAFCVCLKSLLNLQVPVQQGDATVCAAGDNDIRPLATTTGSFRKLVVALQALLKEAELLPTQTQHLQQAEGYASLLKLTLSKESRLECALG